MKLRGFFHPGKSHFAAELRASFPATPAGSGEKKGKSQRRAGFQGGGARLTPSAGAHSQPRCVQSSGRSPQGRPAKVWRVCVPRCVGLEVEPNARRRPARPDLPAGRTRRVEGPFLVAALGEAAERARVGQVTGKYRRGPDGNGHAHRLDRRRDAGGQQSPQGCGAHKRPDAPHRAPPREVMPRWNSVPAERQTCFRY